MVYKACVQTWGGRSSLGYTAAIGFAKRRGLGKIRHLHCADLWVQEKVGNGDIEILKILGTDNPADAFTKYLDRAGMENVIAAMNLEFKTGRAKTAPATIGLEKSSTERN